MFLAVPIIIKIAFSILSVFRSAILIVAISLTCSSVTVPTFSRFGCAAPFFAFANFAKRTEAGGDFNMID
jgi:hypothetical protein